MRYFISFGAPLDMSSQKDLNDETKDGVRYRDYTDRTKEQQAYIDKFQLEMLAIMENFKEENPDGMEALLTSDAIRRKEFRAIMNGDMGYAVFSVLFVILYFVFHLESWFLSMIGMLLIGFSFSLSALIYQGIFRITYLSNLHYLVVFIVLGIAADDIFVFIDAWRQSECIEVFKGDKLQRMTYAWKRAVRAIAITSGTTTVAFLANVMSP